MALFGVELMYKNDLNFLLLSYQLMGVNPSKSVYFIRFPLTSSPIFATKTGRVFLPVYY
jgi:hypothetical protein